MALIQSEHNGSYLTFNDATHRYTLDGNSVPGVTGMLKGGLPTSDALIGWKAGKAAEYAVDKGHATEFLTPEARTAIIKEARMAWKTEAAKAAAIGTIVHDYAYLYEIGKLDESKALLQANIGNDKVVNGINKFLDWKSKNNDVIISTEAIVASVEYQFGGKFDRLAVRNGKIVLSDFKTSNGFYVDQFIQLGAYTLAIKEWLDLDVEQIEILRFGKEDGAFEVHGYNRPEACKFMATAIRTKQTYDLFHELEAEKPFKRFEPRRKKP